MFPPQPASPDPHHLAAAADDGAPLGQALTLTATLEQILISPGHDYYRKRQDPAPLSGIHSVPHVRCLPGRGLEGDRYVRAMPGHTGQVTFLAAEVIDQVRTRFNLPDLTPAPFRRNLILRGADLPSLIEQTFLFQGVLFFGAQECKPCIWMDRAIAEGVLPFLRHPFHGGLRAKILTAGTLRVDASSI